MEFTDEHKKFFREGIAKMRAQGAPQPGLVPAITIRVDLMEALLNRLDNAEAK